MPVETPKPETARPAAPAPTAPFEQAPAPVEAIGRPAAPSAPVMPARVAPVGVKGARRSFDKNWTSILVLTVVAVAILGGVLYLLVFRDSGEPETDALIADGVATEIDSTAVGAGAAAGSRQLQLPIRVTVTASGNGLQSFRVSQNGDRAPYWINAGASQTFEADSSLTLWGEGTTAAFSDASLELQGLRWTPTDGQPVTISRANGQRILDSLTTAGSAAPADTAAAPAF